MTPESGAEVETTLARAEPKPDMTVSDDSLPGSPVPRIIKNRFVLENRLGDGGMGVVYKAIDRNRQDADDPVVHVAIKLIGESIQAHPQAALALQREGSRTLRLSHRNIVRMYDFDRDGDLAFLTMELLDGRSLDAIVREHRGGMPFETARTLVEQLCDGLIYAHREGIIHSDLKPSNVFVTTQGVVKILDFGIATPLRGLNADRPETSFNPRRMGALSPSHASVEMWSGMDADPRDDIYSLGCIVYQMLAGKHPFKGTDAPTAFAQDMKVASIPGLSRRQNQALRSALSFRREHRIESVQRFRDELLLAPSTSTSWKWEMTFAAVLAVAGAAGIWLAFPGSPLRSLPDASETTKAPEEPPPVTVARDTPVVAVIAAGSFEQRCEGAPSMTLLDTQLESGLAAQTRLAFAAGEAAQTEAAESIRKTAECVRELRQLGFDSPEARAWLADVDADLKQP
jgi:serine/threonine protein kinase